MREPRLVMRPSRRGVTGVSLFGRYNYTSARPGLHDHAHRGAIEICFLVKGCQTYRLGGRDYRLKGGDVFIAFPNEEHSSGGSPEEKGTLYWMTLQVPHAGATFLGLPQPLGEALFQTLLGINPRHFRGSWKMKEHLDAITRLYHQPPSPLHAFAMANRVGAFLWEIVSSAQTVPARALARPLQPVLDYIEHRLDEPLDVPQLAAQTGLSVARFKTRFKQEIGMPPGEYVLRARIAEAQRRLARKNATVTEVAFELGFSSSQYFATVFKRFTGHTPSGGRNATQAPTG